MIQGDRIVLGRARDEVRDLLRRMIVTGKLGADERIEEVEMSRRIGVSRTPLREALIALESDGLVQSQPRSGFVVSPINEALVRETYPILSALEVQAVRLAGPRLCAMVPQLRRLNRNLAATANKTRQFELDRAVHRLLCSACGNDRLLGLLEIERTRASRFDGAAHRGTASQKQSCLEHEQVIAAIGRQDFDEAASALAKHWKRGTEVVVKWLATAEKGRR